MPEHGVGAEHPLNDRLQNVFLLVFLVVWAADSFFSAFALNLLGLVWLLITAPLEGANSYLRGLLGKSLWPLFSTTKRAE